MNNFKVSTLLLAMFTICSTSALAQSTCKSDGIGGVRCNDGSGWQSDGFGGQRGTGNNAGRGWQSDGLGGQRGTGDNAGRGWQSDGFGGQRGTGDNSGIGWQSDGIGGLRVLAITAEGTVFQMVWEACAATKM